MKNFRIISKLLDWFIWIMILITMAVIVLVILHQPSRAQHLFDNPVYRCVMSGRSNAECRALAREALKRPAIEGFIAENAKRGISREASIRNWRIIGSRSTKTYRCKPDGKEFTCERE